MFNFVLLALSLLSLNTKEANPEQVIIKGKVVYKTCASLVVQITDSAYYNLGQKKWQRTAIDQEFEHVFLVKNRCAILETAIKKDEEFSFTVVNENAAKNDCPQCMLFDYPPNIALNISVIKNKEKD